MRETRIRNTSTLNLDTTYVSVGTAKTLQIIIIKLIGVDGYIVDNGVSFKRAEKHI
jgi:hypothetical protein